MVNLVDQALRGPLFERAAGLASGDVTLADPAVGTGTFLLGALRKIAANVEKGSGRGHGPRGDRRRRSGCLGSNSSSVRSPSRNCACWPKCGL
jgi:hypothetical protein